MKKETFTRAKREIYGYVLAFCTLKSYHITLGAQVDLEHAFMPTHDSSELIKGDLVLLQYAIMESEYILSWFVETRHNNGQTEYLLQSIETGNYCWWWNIGLAYLNRKTVGNFPTWKWNDKQFELMSKWNKCVLETREKPKLPVFNDDGTVILATREYFGNETKKEFVIDKWEKVTLKRLKQLLKSSTVTTPV